MENIEIINYNLVNYSDAIDKYNFELRWPRLVRLIDYTSYNLQKYRINNI